MSYTREQIRPILEAVQDRFYKVCGYPSNSEMVIYTLAEIVKMGAIYEAIVEAQKPKPTDKLKGLFTEANRTMVYFNNGMPNAVIDTKSAMFRSAAHICFVASRLFKDLPGKKFNGTLWNELLKAGKTAA